jgi:hypothetical protein
MMRRFEVHYRDEDLPQDVHGVELMGSPRHLVWPDLCPNCGAPASEQIVVRKIFRRMSGGPEGEGGWEYVIRSAEIPFCAACAERHRQATPPLTRAAVVLDVLRSPLMIAVVGATTFAVISFQPAVVGTRGHWMGLALFGFFVITAVWSALAAWWSTRVYRVPRLSEIARACDFSDNLGNLIVGERHIYAIRNAKFAAALAEANRDRIVTDADRERVRRVEFAFGLLVLALVVVAAILLWGR